MRFNEATPLKQQNFSQKHVRNASVTCPAGAAGHEILLMAERIGNECTDPGLSASF